MILITSIGPIHISQPNTYHLIDYYLAVNFHQNRYINRLHHHQGYSLVQAQNRQH